MEAIITVVGFLGAGKTTLLKHLTASYLEKGWNPYVILNDYENAYLDMQQFLDQMEAASIMPLSGSCICCSGINELRAFVNNAPPREKGVTLIEANGTSDACSLAGFLGVGLEDRFLPPVQVSVVDVKNWQRRGEHNELEASQIQVSSLIVLTHFDHASADRRASVERSLKELNPQAKIMTMEEVDVTLLPRLVPSANNPDMLDHLKAHWSSCSIDLPRLPHEDCIRDLCDQLPPTLLRVKGCAQIGEAEEYTFFQRTPDGEVYIRPFYGLPVTGAKLLTVGSGSDPSVLKRIVDVSISKAQMKSES